MPHPFRFFLRKGWENEEPIYSNRRNVQDSERIAAHRIGAARAGKIVAGLMRRLAALSLVTIFSFMLLAPLFAPSGEAALPPCCRRHGKHHCSMMEPLTGSQRGVQTIQERCPFSRVAKSAAHITSYQPEAAAQFFAQLVSHPSRAPQTEALRRLSLDRNRQKRGPPARSL